MVIVDVHPELWRLRSAVGGETLSRFEDVVRSAIVFTNAYLLNLYLSLCHSVLVPLLVHLNVFFPPFLFLGLLLSQPMHQFDNYSRVLSQVFQHCFDARSLRRSFHKSIVFSFTRGQCGHILCRTQCFQEVASNFTKPPLVDLRFVENL